MEFEQFKHIRNSLCAADKHITEGKMMRSPAIHYKRKVFAFFSRKKKMVFKLGKDYPARAIGLEIKEFSPFQNKKPLSGWYEVAYTSDGRWQVLATEALKLVQTEQQ